MVTVTRPLRQSGGKDSISLFRDSFIDFLLLNLKIWNFFWNVMWSTRTTFTIYPSIAIDVLGAQFFTLNVFGPNCPNFDSKTFQEVVRFLWPFYRRVFPNDDVITWWCHHPARPPQTVFEPWSSLWGLISTMRSAIFSAEEVTIKPTAFNSPPPLLRWF